jgi:hypothetical protein
MAGPRDFLRVSMTAKTAKVIQEYVVDRTFDDHSKKCQGVENCPHDNLPGARAVEAGLETGVKRATLDLTCPYSFEDPDAQIAILEKLANRLKGIGQNQKGQVQVALLRIADEVLAYARRNPMVVLAEAALPPSRSRVRKAE